MTLQHLGALHPVEQWLTVALAFGPFVLLGAVVWWRRRHDGRDEQGDRHAQPGAETDRTR